MKERPAEPEDWRLTMEFSTVTDALRAYEEARDLLLKDDLDASVFRFQFKGASFVAIVGETPLAGEDLEHVKEALDAGRPGAVPPAVADHLRERRRRFKATKLEFLERRTMPDA
jgi:hypothetical protein